MKKNLFFLSFIVLLAVTSCSQKANRSEKSNAAYADSILVFVNCEEWRDFPQELLTDGYCIENDTIKGIFKYFADRNLRITSAVFWKGEKGEHVKEYYRPEYGERVNNGILDIGVEALVKSPDTDIYDPVELVGYIHRREPQRRSCKENGTSITTTPLEYLKSSAGSGLFHWPLSTAKDVMIFLKRIMV